MTYRLRLALWIIFIIIGVLFLGAAVVTWRLSELPIEATYLTPYIEQGIDHYLPGTHTQIGRTITRWDNIEHVITLQANDISISNKDGDVIATIPSLNVQLSALGLLTGKLLPLGLKIDQPQFRMVRDSAGMLRFGSDVPEDTTNKVQDSSSVRDTLRPMLHDLTHAAYTHDLNIQDILLNVHDDKTQSDWAVHVPEVSIEKSSMDLSGHALLSITQKDQIAALQIDYTYDRKQDLHKLQTHLTSVTPSFFAGGHPGTLGLGALAIFDLPLTGIVTLAVDSDLNVKTASSDIHGDAGNLVYSDFWDQPRTVKTLDIKAIYDHDAPDINLAKVSVDFDGPTLGLTVTGKPSAVPEHDADFQIMVQMDNWPMDQFGQLWPKPVITNPRDWIAKSLSKGNFDHGEAVFRGSLSWNDISNAAITEGGGKVSASGARVDYLDGLPPVDGVNAKGTFDMDQMTVDLSGGGIGALRLVPFSILMTDFEKDVQNIYIPLKFAGPITDVLKLIDVPRLGYAKAIGITPDDVTGNAAGLVELRFPLLNSVEMKDVDIKAHADLTNLVSTKLVNKIDITQGNVVLDLDKSSFDIKGAASLNKIPVQIVWKQYFNQEEGKPLRQGVITGTLGDEQWKTLNIDALNGTHGPVAATLDILQPTKESTTVTGKFDLTGAEIHVDQLNWKKPSSVQAQLNITADIPEKKNITLKSIELSGPDATIKGTATLSPEADELLSLGLNPFIVGRTNASLKYNEMNDDDKTLRFEAEGQSLDVSGLKGGHDVAATDPRPKEYHIHVDKLYTSDVGVIASAQGYAIRDPQGWNQISLKGLADEKFPLNIDLGAKDGKRFFNASCDNFGKALKGLGMTDTVNGGKIQITGQSTVEAPRVINGTVKIGSFTVKGLPALVVLLNATSPFGFQNLLSGDLGFDHLKGKFRWEGDKIELSETHLAGSAVGLDIEGKVDMNSADANLHGVVAPFSMVNNILGAIPLIGDVLTGGNGGGVLAVAYTITGDLNNPKVSVNPASLLTPGFLRNIFFGGSDDEDEAPAATAAPVGAAPPQYPSSDTQGNFNQK